MVWKARTNPLLKLSFKITLIIWPKKLEIWFVRWMNFPFPAPQSLWNYTVWCNKMRIAFKEISFWTVLTRHLGMKTAFYIWKANMFGFLIWWCKFFFITLYKNDTNMLKSTKTQFYEFLVVEYCIYLYMHFFNHSKK